jgi:HK97 family phage major capsid protein
MIALTLDYEAAFATISRQNLTNVPWVQNYLQRKLSEKFYRREDVKVLNFLYSLATAASTSKTVVAEAIIEMIAQVDDNGYGSNGILTTPSKWAEILLTKPSDYSVPGGVGIDTNGNVTIGGLPLLKHQNVTAGDIFVGDWNALYIVQGGAFSIRTSEHHSDNFTKNKVTFLAEAPIGVAFEAPKAIVKKRL